MSTASHHSNDSMPDESMEVIGPEDLEDSPPPTGEEEEEEEVEELGEVDEVQVVEKVEEVDEVQVVEEVTAVGDAKKEQEEAKEEAKEEEGGEEEEEEDEVQIIEVVKEPLVKEATPAPEVEKVEEAAAPAEKTEEVAAPAETAEDPPVEIAKEEPAFEILETPAPEVVAAHAPAPAAAPTPAPVAAPAPAPTPAAARAPVVATRPQITPARPAATLEEEDDEEDDDFDESLGERLVGLTEMFPQFLRTGSLKLVSGSWSLSKASLGFAKAASWIIFSTATVLFMPVMIETERLQLQDAQKAQKNQILLGPGVAQSGGPALGPPPI